MSTSKLIALLLPRLSLIAAATPPPTSLGVSVTTTTLLLPTTPTTMHGSLTHPQSSALLKTQVQPFTSIPQELTRPLRVGHPLCLVHRWLQHWRVGGGVPWKEDT